MMRFKFIAANIVAMTLMGIPFATGQVIDRGKLTQRAGGIPGEEELKTNIIIGPNVTLPATIEVTARKNGTLKIANLSLKILDEYDDGLLYVGGMLHTEFVDVSGDGYKDLVITGTIAHTGDKEGDPIIYSTVTVIYVFDVKQREFVIKFKTGPSLEE